MSVSMRSSCSIFIISTQNNGICGRNSSPWEPHNSMHSGDSLSLYRAYVHVCTDFQTSLSSKNILTSWLLDYLSPSLLFCLLDLLSFCVSVFLPIILSCLCMQMLLEVVCCKMQYIRRKGLCSKAMKAKFFHIANEYPLGTSQRIFTCNAKIKGQDIALKCQL